LYIEYNIYYYASTLYEAFKAITLLTNE